MEIVQENNEKNGVFKAIESDVEAGNMTYVWAGDNKIIIDHTGVKEEFNGKGVGKKLLMAAVNFAREKNIKIMPLCPFAKASFEKNSEIRDVLA